MVVLVGQNKAVAIAVRNVSGRRRWSKLREWLTVSMGAQNFRSGGWRRLQMAAGGDSGEVKKSSR